MTFISILRGINVAGHNMIKMDALRKIYIDLGYKNITTYIQSGNVLFQSDEKDHKILEKQITSKLGEVFSLNVPVLVIEKTELERIFENNPFTNDRHEDIDRLYVMFLSKNPDMTGVDKIKGDFGSDEYIIGDKAIYLYLPNGAGRSKLTINLFEKHLKVTATARNWKTVTELVRLVKSIEN
jgi:uncharacterized protein (DUF1697 family)